jgi:thiosulfate/3-mercaptopyruvate sulfurtransferase
MIPEPTSNSRKNKLIETEWLSRHLKDKEIIIVDLRSREEYDKGHIENAVHLNFKEITGDEIERRKLPPENTPDILGNLGIDKNTLVIAYDDDSSHYAARLFWILEYFGHKKVAILNGGFRKWVKENRELTNLAPDIEKRIFESHPDSDKIATAEYVLKSISNPKVVLLDVRSQEEYSGEKIRAKRGGHIPGAVNIEWKKSMNEDQTFKSSQELNEIFSKKGVTIDKEIITYCQLAVRASHTYFTLKMLGYPKVKVYNGSWGEWGNDPNLPIEK